MNDKRFQSVINLDDGGTAALSLDIMYFPQLPVQITEESLKVLVDKFLDSILPSLISSMNLSCQSKVNLVIHSVIPLPVGQEGLAYQCKDGLKISIAEESHTCAKYQDKPHHHYLCQVVRDSRAPGNEAGSEVGKRMKTNDSTTTEDSQVKPLYGDFFKIPDLPLQKIISYLDLNDLKNFSVLSKDLRKLVLPSLISSSVINFEDESEVPDLLAFIQPIIPDLNRKTGLHIDSRSFTASPEGSAALLQLLQKFGPHIKHLGIVYAYSKKFECSFQDISIPVLGNGQELFPSLKSLLIHVKNPKEDSRNNKQILRPTPVLKSILGNAPALKIARLKCGKSKESTSLLFKLIQDSGLAITNLEISKAFVTDTNLGYLESLNLEELGFTEFYNFKPNDAQSFRNFLNSQRHTLKYLSLELCRNFMAQFIFPRMEKLETLKLTAEGDGNLPVPLTPVSYPSQLPKLKTIEVSGYFENTFFPFIFSSEIEPSTSVKEVILSVFNFNGLNLPKLAHVCKCLSKLEIPFDKKLANVWKDLAGLEELSLLAVEELDIRECWDGPQLGGTWIDEIITGISIGADQLHSKIFTDEDIQDYEETYEENERDSLAALEKLKLLRLRPAKKSAARLMITDISFRLVLSKMESLKCIDFCGTHPSFVGTSKKVLDEMEKKIVLLFGDKKDWYY